MKSFSTATGGTALAVSDSARVLLFIFCASPKWKEKIWRNRGWKKLHWPHTLSSSVDILL